MKYPTDIWSDGHGDGVQRIHQGHGLDRAMLRADLEYAQGPPEVGEELIVQEVHFHYVPRIKNCDRLDGWGCDMQGEWHGHWTEVRPNPDAAFTLAFWGRS